MSLTKLKKPYQVRVNAFGKRYFLGWFETEEKGAEVWDKAEAFVNESYARESALFESMFGLSEKRSKTPYSDATSAKGKKPQDTEPTPEPAGRVRTERRYTPPQVTESTDEPPQVTEPAKRVRTERVRGGRYTPPQVTESTDEPPQVTEPKPTPVTERRFRNERYMSKEPVVEYPEVLEFTKVDDSHASTLPRPKEVPDTIGSMSLTEEDSIVDSVMLFQLLNDRKIREDELYHLIRRHYLEFPYIPDDTTDCLTQNVYMWLRELAMETGRGLKFKDSVVAPVPTQLIVPTPTPEPTPEKRKPGRPSNKITYPPVVPGELDDDAGYTLPRPVGKPSKAVNYLNLTTKLRTAVEDFELNNGRKMNEDELYHLILLYDDIVGDIPNDYVKFINQNIHAWMREFSKERGRGFRCKGLAPLAPEDPENVKEKDPAQAKLNEDCDFFLEDLKISNNVQDTISYYTDESGEEPSDEVIIVCLVNYLEEFNKYPEGYAKLPINIVKSIPTNPDTTMTEERIKALTGPPQSAPIPEPEEEWPELIKGENYIQYVERMGGRRPSPEMFEKLFDDRAYKPKNEYLDVFGPHKDLPLVTMDDPRTQNPRYDSVCNVEYDNKHIYWQNLDTGKYEFRTLVE